MLRRAEEVLRSRSWKARKSGSQAKRRSTEHDVIVSILFPVAASILKQARGTFLPRIMLKVKPHFPALIKKPHLMIRYFEDGVDRFGLASLQSIGFLSRKGFD